MEYGFHPPTIYFPLVVHGAIMIEPTETECKNDLDVFIEAMKAIDQETRENLEHVRCRICGLCHPCPQGIPISWTLGTDVVYDHYRTMGSEVFRAFPWSRERIEKELETRPKKIAAIESCTRCGICEERCSYGLPVMDMLASMLPGMRDMVRIYQELSDA